MPIARDGPTKVAPPSFMSSHVVLIVCVSDLDPVPVHMRTWGGLVCSLALP